MIVAFSTSSPWASVAALTREGEVLWSSNKEAPRNASHACLEMLESMRVGCGLELADAELFLADVGPGSFTGVRVGVILAKTFGYVYSKPVGGADAFDLVAPDRVVALPSKKNEFFVRVPGEAPYRTDSLPADALGYGFGVGFPPNAANFAHLMDRMVASAAAEFLPEYLIEPSISIPKKPFREASS